MKYLQFSNQKYKGKRLVAFIGENAPVDPEETKLKLKPLFIRTDEYKKQQEFSAQKAALMAEQIKVNKKYNRKVNLKTGKFRGSRQEKDELHAEFHEIGRKLEELESEIVEHAKKADEAYRQLFQEHKVCSAPRGAILLDKEALKKWSDLFSKLQSDECLCEDGEIVFLADLEAERIAGLSETEKEREKNDIFARKVRAAIQFKNELEIQGDEEALKKSQEWLKLEKAKIEEQYASS